MSMNTETEIQSKVKEALQGFVGQINKSNNEMKKQIENTIKQQVNKLVEDGFIHAPINQVPVKVDTLWQSWSLKQKIKWVFLNYLGFGRKKIRDYEINREILVDALSTLDGITEDIDEQRDYTIRNFDENYRPWYYESTPKTVLVTDITFMSVKPIEYVKCDFVVNGKL